MVIPFRQILSQTPKTPKTKPMKKLKIIGYVLFIAGFIIQVITFLFEGLSFTNLLLADPFFWGAIITCLGALLLTICRIHHLTSTKPKIEPIIFRGRNYRFRAHDSYKKYTDAGSEERNKNIIVVDTNILPERYDVYFGSKLTIAEDACNSSFTEKISEEDRRSQQIHCQLTTPGLWPCE